MVLVVPPITVPVPSKFSAIIMVLGDNLLLYMFCPTCNDPPLIMFDTVNVDDDDDDDGSVHDPIISR